MRKRDVHARKFGGGGGFGEAVNVVLWMGGDQRDWAVDGRDRRLWLGGGTLTGVGGLGSAEWMCDGALISADDGVAGPMVVLRPVAVGRQRAWRRWRWGWAGWA